MGTALSYIGVSFTAMNTDIHKLYIVGTNSYEKAVWSYTNTSWWN